ncbi:hypothetical protein CMUS01_14814 [Colletotrichum musicola]|uniref:N-acetyltransferase domain-containing protein n=1 Tax=Colletotrichum musicola TaxID=2175873 RepID=A0A8H6J1B1_9PEZI|nr:hypothetical protein CMUS01_14814 [Colletotrichum musicola]
MAAIHIRDAGISPDDAAFIVEAFDSTLPHLAAVGSGGMWGSQPFSEKDAFAEETAKDVKTSLEYQATGEGDALRIFVAEVEVGTEATPHAGLRYRTADDGRRYLSVGAAFVREEWLPDHVKGQFDVEEVRTELEGREGFVFLDVLVADCRTGGMRQGAGEALVTRACEHGVEKGKKILYLDAWSGNDRKLVRYYERLGFTAVAGFELKRAGKTTWPDTILRKDLVN